MTAAADVNGARPRCLTICQRPCSTRAQTANTPGAAPRLIRAPTQSKTHPQAKWPAPPCPPARSTPRPAHAIPVCTPLAPAFVTHVTSTSAEAAAHEAEHLGGVHGLAAAALRRRAALRAGRVRCARSAATAGARRAAGLRSVPAYGPDGRDAGVAAGAHPQLVTSAGLIAVAVGGWVTGVLAIREAEGSVRCGKNEIRYTFAAEVAGWALWGIRIPSVS